MTRNEQPAREHEMDDRARFEYGLEAYKQTQDLVRFLDAKALALSGLYTFSATTFFRRVDDLVYSKLVASDIRVYVALLGAMLLLFNSWELFILINKIVKPRSDMPGLSPDNMYYFQHVANHDAARFWDVARAKSEKDVVVELYAQLHQVSKIAQSKTVELSKAFDGWLVSLLLLAVFYLLTTNLTK